MENFNFGFKEIILSQSSQDKWKEIMLNTGGTQSTLQDIKLPEKAGGYWYKDSSKFYTRNRFIYWRLTCDCVELCEASLDVTLSGAQVKLRPPPGTPALACWAHESPPNYVTIFFATVNSLHRIQLPHPDQLYNIKMKGGNNNVFPSIFQDITPGIINHTSNIHILSHNTALGVVRSVGWACLPSGDAAAALVGSSGGAILLKLPLDGLPSEIPLKRDSSLFSLVSGVLRGRPAADAEAGAVVAALAAEVPGGRLRGFGLTGDGALRWWGEAEAGCRKLLQTEVRRAALRPAGPNLLLFAGCADDSRLFLLRPAAREVTVLKIVYAPQRLELVEMCGAWGCPPRWNGEEGSEGGIWCLWNAPDGRSLLLSHSFASGEEWRGAWCASAATDMPRLSSHKDYAMQLTAPGIFPDRVLRKALAMCQHASGGVRSNLEPEETSSEPLSELLVSATEARCIRAAAQNRNAQDLMHRCWSEMYSWCVQYMEGLEKPLGLIVSEQCGTGGSWCVCVRRDALGFIWPLPPLHSLLLADLTLDEGTLPDEGVKCLVGVAGAVERAATALEAESDENEETVPVSSETTPDKVVTQLALKLREDVDFQMWVEEQLSRIPDLQQAILALDEILKLHAPEIELEEGDAEMDAMSEADEELEEWEYLFASDLGINLVTEALDQMAAVRASVCRGVLVAMNLCGSGVGGASAVHLQAFSALRWLHRAPCPAQPRATQAQELLGAGARALLGVHSGKSVGGSQKTVAARWAGGAGGERTRRALRNAVPSAPLWHQLLHLYSACLGSMLWGVSDNFTFGWWLAGVGEPRLVKKYVQLMEPWCEWNARSRQVILGLAELELGDSKTALAAFCRAAPGVRREPFLRALVTADLSPARALVAYYLKVMKLFELQGASECVLQLAETAIAIADKDDPNLAMLHSVVFRAALEWGGEEGIQRAIAAAARHPAPAQRYSAAAALLAHLGKCGRLDALLSAGASLASAAARAAAARARLGDAAPRSANYDFLAALHWRAGRHAKAAAALQERALRCAALPAPLASLRRRERCLLAALHSLRLAAPDAAFLLRPADRHAPHDGNSAQKKTRMTVISPADLKKELTIVNAQLAFAEKSPLKVCPDDDPRSLGVELCAMGAAGAALSLGQSLFARATGADSEATAEAITAAALSTLTAQCLQHPNDSLYTSHRNGSDEWRDRGWRELRACIESVAKARSGGSHAHSAVTSKLLSMGAFLPHWLRSQHMELNAGELIEQLLLSGRLLEASEACVEALHSSISTAAGVGAHNRYPPLTAIDNVLDELKYHIEDDQQYKEIYEILNQLVEEYIKVAKRRSETIKVAKFNIFTKA